MINKNIEYTVTADTKQAVAAMGALDKQTTQTATKSMPMMAGAMDRARLANMSMMRVIQDAPYFFSSFQMGVMAISNNIDPLIYSISTLKAEAGGLKGAFRALAGTFMGPQGFLLIASVAVSAITAITLAMRGTKEETKETKKAVDEYKKSLQTMIKDSFTFETEKGDKLTVNERNIKGLLARARDQRKLIEESLRQVVGKGYKGTEFAAEGALVSFGFTLEKGVLVPIQKTVKETYQWLEANGLVIKQLEDWEKQLQSGKMLRELLQTGGLKPVGTAAGAGITIPPGRKTPIDVTGLRGVRTPRAGSYVGMQPIPGVEDIKISQKELEQYYMFAESLADSAAWTMRDAFMMAWDDIFGHANSLLEMFLQRMAMGLFSRFANIASGGIFNAVSDFLGLAKPVGGITGRRLKYE